MFSDLYKTGISAFMRVRDKLRLASSDSLISLTDAGRVEPVVLIDQSCMQYDSIGQVQQSMLSLFSGYYLQAVAFLNTIGTISVVDRLDPLNPNRKAENVLLGGSSWLIPAMEEHREARRDDPAWMLSAEAYKDGLPFPENNTLRLAVESASLFNNPSTSLQAKDDAKALAAREKQYAKDNPAQKDPKRPGASGNNNSLWNNQAGEEGGAGAEPGKAPARGLSFGGDLNKQINELANLSVGKTYSVELQEGQNKATVPVTIRLLATLMPTRELVHILSTGSEDNSFKERWHGWRSGRLAFWKDLVLCNDLIDQRRKSLMNDSSGVLSKLLKVQRNNQLATIVSGNPTVASASNLVVMSRETADELELRLEGKLDKFEVRQRMMQNTYLMIVAVIDNDYQRVTFYHRGVHLPTTVRLADLKGSNKGNGPDVADILKAYQLGNAPTL